MIISLKIIKLISVLMGNVTHCVTTGFKELTEILCIRHWCKFGSVGSTSRRLSGSISYKASFLANPVASESCGEVLM